MPTMRQYEIFEWSFPGGEDKELSAEIRYGNEHFSIRGFYAGDGMHKLRFLPLNAGDTSYRFYGVSKAEGTVPCEKAAHGRHGPVRTEGTHFRCADGSWFYPFGTTVYALVHQSEALIDETIETLKNAPFNKLRTCVFPKDYNYNKNEPSFFPFERREDGSWDTARPCYAYWEHLERRLRQLDGLGIEVNLILFHPYDRWGFASMPMEDNLRYLDYLLRRLAAFPNLWWSLANEYDLCYGKSLADWECIERYVREHDPYGHLLSNHNYLKAWDASREAISHVSWQTRRLAQVAHTIRKVGKPVMIDECRYEGNLPEFWGNISAQDMTQRFWRVVTQGGYCTHGETFLPGSGRSTRTGEADVVWWAKGGLLQGESVERIAFLRQIVEPLPGPLEPNELSLNGLIGMDDAQMARLIEAVPEGARDFLRAFARMDESERDVFVELEYGYAGHCGDEAFLWYKDDQCCARSEILLPESGSYTVEVIDTWEMRRSAVLQGVSGAVTVELPGKPYMAILATRE